ncbi:MAG: histidine kinase [Planctomycetota bacterium]
MPDDQVYDLHEADDGSLWIGTYRGLARWHPEQTQRIGDEPSENYSGFDVWTEDNGLPDERIGGVLVDDDGHIWFGSEGGLVRMHRDAAMGMAAGREPKGDDLRVFGSTDGTLMMYGSSAYALPDGRLLFPGAGGVCVVDPSQMPDPPPPPHVQLGEITVAGMPLEDETVASDATNQPVRLPPGGRFFGVRLNGIDLHESEDLLYRHRLLGLDDRWQHADAQTRRASYTNVPPGEYTLQVSAARPGETWSDAVQQAIVVPHTMVETVWFRTSMGVLAAALFVVGFFLWKRRRDAAFSAVLAERTRMAAELHDTLLQSLYGMQLKAQAARRRMDRDPEGAKEVFDDALSQAGSAIAEARQRVLASPLNQSLDQVADSTSYRPVDTNGSATSSKTTLADTVEQTALHTAKLFGVLPEDATDARPVGAATLLLDICRESDDEYTNEGDVAPGLREVVTRLVSEATANAARHAKASYIKVSYRRCENGGADVKIEDDGQGFDLAARLAANQSAGLRLMHTRSRRAHVACDIDSVAGNGTRVHVRVPSLAGSRAGSSKIAALARQR